MINEKIIDTHLHIEDWDNEEGNFIDAFEIYRESSGLHSFNICALPVHNGVGNNLMAAFYKLAHPNTYAHGGMVHVVPVTEDAPQGFDLVTQYKELMEIGFDGIKMIEGKPNCHKKFGKSLNTPSLNALYSEMEKDGTHIVFHVNDPEEFWDKSKMSQETIEQGWFYGDGSYASHEELYAQAEKMLEEHPRLCVTFAHFYFCGEKPEKLAALFEKYPNLCVDLTPGTEMYASFEENHEYFRSFFIKYSKRIMLGTDGTFPWVSRFHIWCMDVLYKFISTNESMMAFNDKTLTGINLPKSEKEDILFGNFERRVGEKPKEINKAALRAYYEKYKHLILEEELPKFEALAKKYL